MSYRNSLDDLLVAHWDSVESPIDRLIRNEEKFKKRNLSHNENCDCKYVRRCNYCSKCGEKFK